jgi:hypothetical protein
MAEVLSKVGSEHIELASFVETAYQFCKVAVSDVRFVGTSPASRSSLISDRVASSFCNWSRSKAQASVGQRRSVLRSVR